MSQASSRTERPSAWRSLSRWLPGLLISGVALFLVLRTITWRDVAAALMRINPWSFALVLLLFLLSQVARALAWHTLLQRKVPFWRVYFVMNIGYLLNNFLPLRMGEVGRAVVMGRKTEVGVMGVFSTILVERAYDMAIAASLLLGTLPLVLEMKSSRPLALTVLALVALGLVALFLAARNREKVIGWLAPISRRSAFLERWFVSKIDSVLRGFAALTDPRLFVLSLLFMLVSWGLALLQDWVLLRGVIPGAPFWWVPFCLSAAALGAALPSVPAAIGVFEGAIVAALGLVAVSAADALAFALLLHGLTIVLSSSMGVLGLIKEGENLSSLYQSLQNRKPATADIVETADRPAE